MEQKKQQRKKCDENAAALYLYFPKKKVIFQTNLPMTKNVRQVGAKVAASPAPAAKPPDEMAPAMTAATTKFFTSGRGLSKGV